MGIVTSMAIMATQVSVDYSRYVVCLGQILPLIDQRNVTCTMAVRHLCRIQWQTSETGWKPRRASMKARGVAWGGGCLRRGREGSRGLETSEGKGGRLSRGAEGK